MWMWGVVKPRNAEETFQGAVTFSSLETVFESMTLARRELRGWWCVPTCRVRRDWVQEAFFAKVERGARCTYEYRHQKKTT